MKLGAPRPELVGMPVTEAQLRELHPFEFQNWVIQSIQGHHAARRSGDMGIDGYTFFNRDPVQVKRTDKVGRPVVDSFETAIEREGRERGCIVGFSFTKDGHEEVARAKAEKGL